MRKPKPMWQQKHTDILTRQPEGEYRDLELRNIIWASTGDKFEERTVAEHRRALGIAPCRRNDWNWMRRAA